MPKWGRHQGSAIRNAADVRQSHFAEGIHVGQSGPITLRGMLSFDLAVGPLA